jgi:MoxR-like ATPase
VGKAVIGQDAAVTGLVIALLCRGHVLLEGVPGVAKTLLVRAVAASLQLEMKRVQFTPDLMPGDVTGSLVYDARTSRFDFRPGPVFTNLLLADEINRTPPKTQAALLEAMQEKQVTVEGRTFQLPRPFHVLATANPVEYEGTYPLPEAQLDRFLMRVSFGYPSLDEEWQILSNRMARQQEEQVLDAVVTPEELLTMQAAIEATVVDESIGRYCVALTAATRTHGDVLMGASPRGALGLLLCARAYAVIDGRDYVTPEDVKAVALAVLAHRITVKPELWMSNVSGAGVVASILRTVDTPSAREVLPGSGPGSRTGPGSGPGSRSGSGARPGSRTGGERHTP